MTELQFTDPHLAALYDRFHPPQARDDFAFYLPMIMAARSVLDVGCGTGALLRMARDAGHTGRLVGLDPAPGMLEQARQRTDIEWVLGDLSSVSWDRQFDLAIMTGHAFQQLLRDEEIHAALSAVRSALQEGGRFAFETRNPLDRAWERWPHQYGGEIVVDGVPVQPRHQVDPPDGDIVYFTATYTSPAWRQPCISHGALRFLPPHALAAALAHAGLTIQAQYGDWDQQPVTNTSPEIITIARRMSRS